MDNKNLVKIIGEDDHDRHDDTSKPTVKGLVTTPTAQPNDPVDLHWSNDTHTQGAMNTHSEAEEGGRLQSLSGEQGENYKLKVEVSGTGRIQHTADEKQELDKMIHARACMMAEALYQDQIQARIEENRKLETALLKLQLKEAQAKIVDLKRAKKVKQMMASDTPPPKTVQAPPSFPVMYVQAAPNQPPTVLYGRQWQPQWRSRGRGRFGGYGGRGRGRPGRDGCFRCHSLDHRIKACPHDHQTSGGSPPPGPLPQYQAVERNPGLRRPSSQCHCRNNQNVLFNHLDAEQDEAVSGSVPSPR